MKHFFTFLLIVFSLSGFGQEVVTRGLSSYYPFAGTADDARGKQDAKVKGAELSTDRFGNPNHAYQLDGVDDIIQFGDSTGKHLQGEYTLSLWIYNDNIAKKEEAGALKIPKGWHHIVVTNGPSGKGYFYFDNKLIDSSRAGAPSLIGNSSFLSGQTKKDAKPFKGKMDDIRIYGRQINKYEVDSLFNEPNPVRKEDLKSSSYASSLKEFSVFPNPARTNLYISGYGVSYNRIEVMDILGKKIQSINGDTKKLNVADLKDGLYVIRLYENDELIGIRKFVIEK